MAVTWNPSDSAAGISFSNGNRTITASSAALKSVRASAAASGLVYWEVTCTDTNGGVGVVDGSASLNSYGGSDTHGFGYKPSNGDVFYNGAVVLNIGSTSSGAVIRCALNATTKKFWVQPPGGNWNGSGTADPVSGTAGADCSGFSGSIYASASPIDNASVVVGNFAGPFTYAVPSGYSAYDPAFYRSLAPSLATNSATFYAPTATRGAVTVSPPLVGGANAVFGPKVSQGQTLASPLVSGGSTLYAATVLAGAVTVAPAAFANAAAFFAAIVTPGAAAIGPPIIAAASTLFGPSVGRGAVSVAPGRLGATAGFPPPTVSQPTGDRTLAPPRLNAGSMIFAPTVSGGVQTLLPALLPGGAGVFAPRASNDNPPPAPGTYPLAVTGQPLVRASVLAPRGLVVAQAVAAGGAVIASALKGRP